MNYLHTFASNHFLNLTRISYFSGLTSWGETEARLLALRLLCHPNDPILTNIDKTLQLYNPEALEEIQAENRWMNADQSDDSGNHKGHASIIEEQLSGDGSEIILHFTPGSHTGLSKWEFHQADDDFFPSIPHGHWEGKNHPKLDPYQGWVYQRGEQIRREKRKNIIRLWNDEKFREFSSIAIDYYLTHFPKYQGWRVSHPRRLPQRRR